MRNFRLVANAILLFALPAWSAADEQDEIKDLYRRGLGGDKTAVEQCIAKLEGVLQSQPSNQLARVYLGSALTLRSRDLGFGPKKLQALQRGLALMDRAVETAPEDFKVRLARALTTSSLPGFFGRGLSARKDFERLAEVARQTPEKFEAGDLQVVFYHAGLAAKSAGDKTRAIALWREARRTPADPKLSEKVEAELTKAE